MYCDDFACVNGGVFSLFFSGDVFPNRFSDHYFLRRPDTSSKTDRVVTIDSGMQDDVWGRAVSLRGQLGSVAVFNDVLTEAQVKALNSAGIMRLVNQSNKKLHKNVTIPGVTYSMLNPGPDKKTVMNEVPGDIKSKLVVYYAAKACHRYVCRDLSSSAVPRDGTLTGHKIVTWDVKVRNLLLEELGYQIGRL